MIKLLDCTLRDGGYINDWEFGEKAIKDIKEELELSGIDMIELGFLRNEPENKDRTIFNSIKNVKKIIGNKLPNREYVLMAEVSNPFPLDMLDPCDEESPEIIRVIVWKRMLKEGYEYCKGIVEKGYKLCVQPARVSQYSDQEFVDMIKMFNELNPMAIYVVDSWGTMYKDELLHYLKLADENLKDGISVGYHGHNNMMQAFEVACAFCEQNLKRDLIIDASVYGIGRGAGNLNTEIFAKWATKKLGKSYDINPLIRIYDKYIKHIYNNCEKWGFSVPYLITAKYNANPNFARYLENKGLSCEVIEKCISAIPEEDRIIFKPEIINRKENQLCIVIITANKPIEIFYFLKNIASSSLELGIDVIVYDGSKQDDTKFVTQNFIDKGYTNIKYEYYKSNSKVVSIDKKVISAYQKFSEMYQYVWVTRDALGINLKEVIDGIKDYMNASYDLIVVDEKDRDYKKHGNKIYTDCKKLFLDQTHQMTVLGATIVKSSTIKSIIEEVPLDKEKNFGIWQPIAYLTYFANHEFCAASWVGSLWKGLNIVIDYKKTKGTSFWHKQTLWQWGERWYKAITCLPDVYNEYKPRVLKFELIDCKPFSLNFLAHIRKIGGLNLSIVNKYKKYLPYVCDTPICQFYIISLIPRFIVKRVVRIYEKNKLKNYRKLKNKAIKKKLKISK